MPRGSNFKEEDETSTVDQIGEHLSKIEDLLDHLEEEEG
jgi:hypothetical protein